MIISYNPLNTCVTTYLWKTNCITGSTPTAIALHLDDRLDGDRYKIIYKLGFGASSEALLVQMVDTSLSSFKYLWGPSISRLSAWNIRMIRLRTHRARSISFKGLLTFTLRAFVTVILPLRTFFF